MTTYKKLYFTDNGALNCEDHLGTCAKYTGRDLSGQKIRRVNAEAVQHFANEGLIPKCETCGCEASLVGMGR